MRLDVQGDLKRVSGGNQRLEGRRLDYRKPSKRVDHELVAFPLPKRDGSRDSKVFPLDVSPPSECCAAIGTQGMVGVGCVDRFPRRVQPVVYTIAISETVQNRTLRRRIPLDNLN